MAIGKLFQHVANFFMCRDPLPWTDRRSISGCVREIIEAEADASAESNNGDIVKLSWAFVHSRHPEDVLTGIAMLKASLNSPNSTSLQEGEKLYLLAVGNYRRGYDFRSRNFVEQSLKISPDFCPAQYLQRVVEQRITRDIAINYGITAIVIGGVAALVLRNREH